MKVTPKETQGVFEMADEDNEPQTAGFNDHVKNTLNSRHPSPRYGVDDHWSDVILKEGFR
jgi:hypothetical protein